MEGRIGPHRTIPAAQSADRTFTYLYEITIKSHQPSHISSPLPIRHSPPLPSENPVYPSLSAPAAGFTPNTSWGRMGSRFPENFPVPPPRSPAALSTEKLVALNRRARHEYFIESEHEAGLVLQGSEVKSLRAGKANLSDAYVRIDRGEAWLIGAHIQTYEQANRWNHDPTRSRKLLLHRREIGRLGGQVERGGYTLIPLKLYFKGQVAKLMVGLCKGKKLHDKRATEKERESNREIRRVLKDRSRGGDDD